MPCMIWLLDSKVLQDLHPGQKWSWDAFLMLLSLPKMSGLFYLIYFLKNPFFKIPPLWEAGQFLVLGLYLSNKCLWAVVMQLLLTFLNTVLKIDYRDGQSLTLNVLSASEQNKEVRR